MKIGLLLQQIALALVIAAYTGAPSLYARTITGVVKNSESELLEGVLIRAASNESEVSDFVYTTAKGEYILETQLTGDLNLSAQLKGYQAVAINITQENTKVDFTLEKLKEPKSELSVFDASKLDKWTQSAQVRTRECRPVIKPCNIFQDKIVATERIGSESSDAVVFRMDIGPACPAAVKVLLDVADFSDEKNENELRLANLVSNQVKANRTDRFPVVYGSKECKNMLFPEKVEGNMRKLIERAKAYTLLSNLEKLAREKGFRRSYLIWKQANSQKSYEDMLSSIKAKFSEYGDFDKIKLSGTVLISELVWGDLLQLYQELSEDEVPRIFDNLIGQGLLAIQELHDLGISHNDLHFGNFLVRIGDGDDYKEIRVLIHDFGKSEYLNPDDWTTNKILADFKTVSNTVLSMNRLGEEIHSKMKALNTYLASLEEVPKNIYTILHSKWID